MSHARDTQQLTFHSLPADVLFEISKHLHPLILLEFQTLSTQWKKASDTDKLWKNEIIGSTNKKAYLAFLQRMPSSVYHYIKYGNVEPNKIDFLFRLFAIADLKERGNTLLEKIDKSLLAGHHREYLNQLLMDSVPNKIILAALFDGHGLVAIALGLVDPRTILQYQAIFVRGLGVHARAENLLGVKQLAQLPNTFLSDNILDALRNNIISYSQFMYLADSENPHVLDALRFILNDPTYAYFKIAVLEGIFSLETAIRLIPYNELEDFFERVLPILCTELGIKVFRTKRLTLDMIIAKWISNSDGYLQLRHILSETIFNALDEGIITAQELFSLNHRMLEMIADTKYGRDIFREHLDLNALQAIVYEIRPIFEIPYGARAINEKRITLDEAITVLESRLRDLPQYYRLRKDSINRELLTVLLSPLGQFALEKKWLSIPTVVKESLSADNVTLFLKPLCFLALNKKWLTIDEQGLEWVRVIVADQQLNLMTTLELQLISIEEIKKWVWNATTLTAQINKQLDSVSPSIVQETRAKLTNELTQIQFELDRFIKSFENEAKPFAKQEQAAVTIQRAWRGRKLGIFENSKTTASEKKIPKRKGRDDEDMPVYKIHKHTG